jgi:3-oxoacyl-[acyl-carrier protein] reductase
VDLGLAGRRAVVAAGTGGLGFACAAALAAEGVRVALCGRTRGRIDEAVVRIGNDAIGLTADLTDPDEAERFVRRAADALGGLDILVTNGPGPAPGNFDQRGAADFPAALDANLTAVVRMCYAAAELMRPQQWGRIVAITSIAAREPIDGLILSNTARAGLTGFLKSMATVVAPDGVTVNSVQPGLHETDRVQVVYGDGIAEETRSIPAGRLGDPADFGAIVTFLCSEQARFVTGTGVVVDGGQHRSLA